MDMHPLLLLLLLLLHGWRQALSLCRTRPRAPRHDHVASPGGTPYDSFPALGRCTNHPQKSRLQTCPLCFCACTPPALVLELL